MLFYTSIFKCGGGIYILSICAFCYMLHLFGVMVFQRSIVNWSEEVHVSSVYVHLLYVTLIWCNDIPLMYYQLEWGICILSIYVHSAICDSYLM